MTAAVGSATEQEILRQPAVWREAAALLSARRREVRQFLEPLLAREDLRIVLTGAGTSAYVGEVAAPALARRLRRRVDAVPTTDLVSDPLGRLAEDLPTLLVSFARSGDSPESTAATALADELLTETHHLVITCDAAGALACAHAGREDSLVLVMPAQANDRGFAMTSSFTSMLLTALLAFLGDDPALVERLGVAGDAVIARRDRVLALLAREPGRVVHLGSGPLAGLAREGALKLLELTAGRVDSYAETSLGFRHGPKALVDDRTLAVVAVSNDPYTRRYDEDIVRELRASTGAEVVTVRAGGDDDGTGWSLPGLGGVDDAFLAIPIVVVSQLLALHASLRHGVTPDDPFPGGSVNRVVQGVRIHPLSP